jgi:hypothetical protein
MESDRVSIPRGLMISTSTAGIVFLFLSQGIRLASMVSDRACAGKKRPSLPQRSARQPLSTVLRTTSSAFLKMPRSASISSPSLFLSTRRRSGAERSAGAKSIVFEPSSSHVTRRWSGIFVSAAAAVACVLSLALRENGGSRRRASRRMMEDVRGLDSPLLRISLIKRAEPLIVSDSDVGADPVK